MQSGDKVYDYYTYIYEQYGKFKEIDEKNARKIIKKVVMTINYGLTRLGCHRKMYLLLKEYQYCKTKEQYRKE
jgi:DNA-directed RNA polymerase